MQKVEILLQKKEGGGNGGGGREGRGGEGQGFNHRGKARRVATLTRFNLMGFHNAKSSDSSLHLQFLR